MSRIGKQPISIPADVKVLVQDQTVSVEGKLGKLTHVCPAGISVDYRPEQKTIVLQRHRDDRTGRSLHGLTRAILQNMVTGVSRGFEKKLEIVGVGYGAFLNQNTLQLRLGYANEVRKRIPEGLTVQCPDQTHVVIRGCDRQMVGQFAAEVRAARKPEPYKGKGVRYEGEHVKIKPGKTAT